METNETTFESKRTFFQRIMVNNNILCVIDFSESSTAALEWTVKVAQLTQAKVTVLFCYRLIATNSDGETLNLKRSMEEDALRRFDEMEKGLVKENAVSCDFVAEIGFFPFRIERFMRTTKIDLLVMASSIIEDFHDYKRMSFDQFLKDARIPIVIVPASQSINVLQPSL